MIGPKEQIHDEHQGHEGPGRNREPAPGGVGSDAAVQQAGGLTPGLDARQGRR